MREAEITGNVHPYAPDSLQAVISGQNRCGDSARRMKRGEEEGHKWREREPGEIRYPPRWICKISRKCAFVLMACDFTSGDRHYREASQPGSPTATGELIDFMVSIVA